MSLTRVLVDPGHRGPDRGAEANGVIEKDLALEVALELEAALVSLAWPAAVTMTRRSDGGATKLTLAERGRIGIETAADLVISIHGNATTGPHARGLMAFHWPGSPIGTEVARAVQRASPAALHRTDVPYSATREQWPRVRNVLQVHRAPAVLVEVGFLTNSEDAAALTSKAVRRELTAAMLAGVARGITLIETQTTRRNP